MTLAVGLLGAVAVLLVTDRVGVPRQLAMQGDTKEGARVDGWLRPLRLRSRASADEGRLQVVVTQAAALLRSGMPPSRVWQAVGEVRVDAAGIPLVDDLAVLVDPTWSPQRTAGLWARGKGGRAAGPAQAERQSQAIVAACRLAAQVGSPLAQVLDSIVVTLVASAEAESDRDAALAGPGSTARILLWLPVLGAALGTALGASPLGLLLSGGPLALVPVVGVVLMVVGNRWTARLVNRARAAGSPP